MKRVIVNKSATGYVSWKLNIIRYLENEAILPYYTFTQSEFIINYPNSNEEAMKKERIYSYQDDDITVNYNLRRCIHAAECVRGLPEVFDPDRRPWIMPNNATAEQISKIILRCPTGALTFDRHDDGEEEAIPGANTIQITDNGPLYVRGNVLLISPDGTILKEETRLALCRCGASENKPYCDNSHQKIGFQASGEVKDDRSETREPHLGGILEIHLGENGPVRLKGNFEITASDGNSTFHGTKASLCRCGGSGKKPFCDGTHRKIGFSTERSMA